jgi:hypothetical protein
MRSRSSISMIIASRPSKGPPDTRTCWPILYGLAGRTIAPSISRDLRLSTNSSGIKLSRSRQRSSVLTPNVDNAARRNRSGRKVAREQGTQDTLRASSMNALAHERAISAEPLTRQIIEGNMLTMRLGIYHKLRALSSDRYVATIGLTGTFELSTALTLFPALAVITKGVAVSPARGPAYIARFGDR